MSISLPSPVVVPGVGDRASADSSNGSDSQTGSVHPGNSDHGTSDPGTSDHGPTNNGPTNNGMDGYFRLQRRLLLATLLLSAVVVAVTAIAGSIATAFSLLVGAMAGLLYLWLLSRSVTRLGDNSRRLSRAQLLVPVALVLLSSRLPQLSILPALLGFLLYKPAVILQAVFDT
jgi:ATP synthase protein I